MHPTATPFRTSWRTMSTVALRSAAVVFRSIERRPAEHGAGVLEVAVAPAVGRDHVEDVEAHALRRLDARLEHPHHVALAAPYRELARRHRFVLRAHTADAHADGRHAVRVRVHACERLTPHLRRAIQTT